MSEQVGMNLNSLAKVVGNKSTKRAKKKRGFIPTGRDRPIYHRTRCNALFERARYIVQTRRASAGGYEEKIPSNLNAGTVRPSSPRS